MAVAKDHPNEKRLGAEDVLWMKLLEEHAQDVQYGHVVPWCWQESFCSGPTTETPTESVGGADSDPRTDDNLLVS